MPEIKQREIDTLIRIEKSLLEDISWIPRYDNPLRDEFRTNILSSRDDQMVFEGYYNRELRKIFLTLRYKNYALVTVHKGIHTNPNGTSIKGRWHKQSWREVEHRKIALNVDHEFNDRMIRKEIVYQFMKENNIQLAGHTYQENLDTPF